MHVFAELHNPGASAGGVSVPQTSSRLSFYSYSKVPGEDSLEWYEAAAAQTMDLDSAVG